MTDPVELARLFAQFGKAFGRRMWCQIEQAGTTPARARLLAALHCPGGCTMGEIGARLGVTPRNVTKLVDGLEAEGLVVREPHPHDRRATLLSLTPRGQIVCKETMLANHAAAAWLFEQLGPPDRQHLTRILRKLLDALEAAGPGG